MSSFIFLTRPVAPRALATEDTVTFLCPDRETRFLFCLVHVRNNALARLQRTPRVPRGTPGNNVKTTLILGQFLSVLCLSKGIL